MTILYTLVNNCRGSFTTAKYFLFLKEKQPDPDENMEQGVDTIEDNDMTPFGFSLCCYFFNLLDILKTLPGINNSNANILISKVKCLAELSKKSQSFLNEILGSTNGTKLFRFLHADASKYEVPE